MKKWIVLLLALLLCATGVCDTQPGFIIIEGEVEPIEETFLKSDLGFSFRYDATRMTVETDMSESGGSLIIFPTETELPVYLELLTADAIGMEPLQFLEEFAPEGTEYEQDLTEDGSLITWFTLPAESADDLVVTYFAIDDGDCSVAAYATWPMEAEEGWGVRLRAVLDTLSFRGGAPVSVRWVWNTEPIGADPVMVDQDGSYVLLTAAETITGLKLLALDFVDCDEEGNVTYDTSVVCEWDRLAPGEPLVLKLAFPGDIPSYGLEFVDSQGETIQYAIAVSGRDGSLLLTAF